MVNVVIFLWPIFLLRRGMAVCAWSVLALLITWKIAQWSEIAVHSIPWICIMLLSKLFVRMWSIKVAVVFVTFVGFVIKGNTLLQYNTPSNSPVALWSPALKKSIFRFPHQIAQFSLFLDNIHCISYAVIENINRRIRHATYYFNDNVWICIEDTFINFNKNSSHFTVKIVKVISQYKR